MTKSLKTANMTIEVLTFRYDDNDCYISRHNRQELAEKLVEYFNSIEGGRPIYPGEMETFLFVNSLRVPPGD